MTDDPSTNSNEWVWRCKYAASGFACSSVLDRHSILCGLTLATPSPVLDSERPASDLIERLTEMVRLIDWRGSEARLRNLLTEAVIALEAADAHRCPTPERDDLAELRALSEAATDGPWTESLNAHAVMTFGDVADEDADESAFYVVDEDRGVNHPEDTAFIIAAANYVRRLLASHPGGEA